MFARLVAAIAIFCVSASIALVVLLGVGDVVGSLLMSVDSNVQAIIGFLFLLPYLAISLVTAAAAGLFASRAVYRKMRDAEGRAN